MEVDLGPASSQATVFDAVIYAIVVLSFAFWVTTHVTLFWGLATRKPAWRGLLGLIIVPLAPIYGFKADLKTRSVIWLASLGAYAAAYIVATGF